MRSCRAAPASTSSSRAEFSVQEERKGDSLGYPDPMNSTKENAADMFEREWQTYLARKSELLAHEGQFVVIRGNEVLGLYPSLAEGFDAGIRVFGPEQFFLHRITREEPTLYNPFIGATSTVPGYART